MTREDPTLGPVRLCPGCEEWWPDDEEFFAVSARACRACVAEYQARRRRMRQLIERANSETPRPVVGRCNALMLRHDRCGRKAGHQYGHRSRAAMDNDKRASAVYKATTWKAAG